MGQYCTKTNLQSQISFPGLAEIDRWLQAKKEEQEVTARTLCGLGQRDRDSLDRERENNILGQYDIRTCHRGRSSNNVNCLADIH